MLFSDTYLTIDKPADAIFKDKGSKFLVFAYPVENDQQIKEILNQLKKEHHTANHHCYAYRLGADKMNFRANDDGEPNNTYYVRSSDYMRLKNIEIGYNVPSNLTKKIGVGALRIYASGQNFLTLTGMKDWDPESPDDAEGSIWVNSQVYPLNKTVTLGLSVTF